MEEIVYASLDDVSRIKALMDGAIDSSAQKDWYVVEELEFIEQHIERDGYTLKYMIDGEFAAFLMVRHPGEAEDNLAYDLIKVQKMPGQMQGGPLQEASDLIFKVSHMESAVVAPGYRGRGLQEKLLKRAEEIERERGVKYLLATVHPENVFSLNNLLKQGFQCVLETEKYGGLRRKILCKGV